MPQMRGFWQSGAIAGTRCLSYFGVGAFAAKILKQSSRETLNFDIELMLQMELYTEANQLYKLFIHVFELVGDIQ